MQLERKVSWGNLFSMGTAVAGVIAVAAVTSHRVDATENRVEKLEKKVETIQDTVSRVDERTKSIEKSVDKQEKMLIEILQKVK